VQIRLEATDLPGRACGPSPERPGGHQNNHVGVQRRGRPAELLGVVPGDAPSATWVIDCSTATTSSGIDVKGPYIQGPPRGRFIYLNWVVIDDDNTFTMFRRAKLMFDGIPPDVLERAADLGTLIGRLALTDAGGGPICAAVRPPFIDWSPGGAG
jgi:sugar/nucleoside kinase (ribokinase family)